ncbi:amidohydrolase family protein [Mycolicibacterium sphagni]|uniref:amidohydrolase family protein n=1 Tax=Mycolicibacterium sphagni TaxID=1786 RepID=UPI0021F36ACD|nr:amidohydrolase family protein [Mycolicibacterium sphagni]MCV7175395.1 amidohydrolase family protein [Mycolicibacterium sphagni]
MTTPIPRPHRIVDAHVHLWDPARTDWYPYLSGKRELNMGDVSTMSRRFDAATYFAESAGWNVEKIINVAAATGWNSIDETIELDRQANVAGHPDVIVGGLPPTESVTETVAALDRQLAAPRFRGVRPMGAAEGPLPPTEVLRALEERDLLVEVMVHPDLLLPTARRLESNDSLVVIIEHAGWPRNGSEEERALWTEGMNALGSLGDNVLCKLSGLAVPLGSMTIEVLAPWLEYAIEAFGADRCMFASNSPVDGMCGTFDELYSTYSAVAARLDIDARDKIFAGNAERVYRC